MNRDASSLPALIGAILLGKEVISTVKTDLKRNHSLNIDSEELSTILREEVLLPDIIESLRESENRRTGADRREHDIPVDNDQRRGGDRRIEDTRSELQKRLQELDVSLDVRTTDMSRGFV